jgi:hypothetical protein
MPPWRRALSMELDQMTGVQVGRDDFREASLVPEETVGTTAETAEEATQS